MDILVGIKTRIHAGAMILMVGAKWTKKLVAQIESKAQRVVSKIIGFRKI